MISFLKNTKSILTWLVCFAYIGLFLPIAVSNITIIALLVFCLIKTTPREILRTIKENRFLQIIAALYFLQVIGLLYTDNLKTGFFILEKKISLLLIPVFVLPLFQKFDVYNNFIFRRIGYITLISSFYLLGVATFRTFVLHDSQAFYFENFTSALVHYVYYSMYFACGSLLLIDALFDTLIDKKYAVLIITPLFVYSLAFLILVASKTGIGVFCLASIFFLYKRIPNKKLFALSLLLLLTAVSVLFYFNPTTRNRFIGLEQNLSFLKLDDFRGHEVYITDLNMRLLFWKISLVHSWRDHLVLTGVGTGDCQDYLDSLYALPQYQLYGYIGWDSHNQWVFTFIQLGVIGVLVMALLYGKYFIEAFKRHDVRFLSFLIITIGFSFSESILESNKGIVFFALLFTILSASYYKRSLDT